ncbi:MAG: hypothetical protein KU38_09460 [Sulfurovum sp. FS08-3]|nr:MAG: hypothetical protein KU38_09460 [Sulfurovum sp. FS08-3]
MKRVVVWISIFLFQSLVLWGQEERMDRDFATPKWFTPSSDSCTMQGGRVDDGSCVAPWENAKAICSANDAWLLSIEELKEAVSRCGGRTNAIIANATHSAYQSCYKAQGFDSSCKYWSATTHTDYRNYAWYIDFSYGGIDNYNKRYRLCVRCVKR